MKTIAIWNRLWGQDGNGAAREKPLLIMREEADSLTITDTRPCAIYASHELKGLARSVYQACDDICTIASLMNTLAKDYGSGLSLEQLQSTLNDLVERRLMLHLDGKFLSLALNDVRTIPDTLEDFPGGYTDVQTWQLSNARYTSPIPLVT
jgi:hypothetical protein